MEERRWTKVGDEMYGLKLRQKWEKADKSIWAVWFNFYGKYDG